MSTYLRGVNDYIGQVVPFKPNLQFHGAVNQALQSKYDANKAKLSNLYGSLLNASLTRDDNKQAREEFFNMIGPELQKISQLDLSQEANVEQAKGLFQSFYQNKNIVKDMVWTKNFNNEVSRMETLKNCTDVEKCGGQYWEEGEKYLLHKQKEFKNADAGSIMNFQDVSFIPYNSVMDKSLKYIKDAGLSVTKDVVTNGYKVTYKNGELVRGPLAEMLNKTIGENPQFMEMYKVKTYVDRKDWVSQKVALGEYDNEQEATVNYISLKERKVQDQLNETLNENSVTREQLDEEIQELENKDNVTQQDKERYERLVQSRNEVVKAESFLNYFKDLEKNKNSKMAVNAYAEILDQQAAAALLTQEISSAIRVGESKDKEVTMEESKFALAEQKFNYDVRLEQLDYQNQRKIKELERDIKIELSELGITESSGSSGSNKETPKKRSEFNEVIAKLNSEYSDVEIRKKARQKAKEKGLTFEDDATEEEINKALGSNQTYKDEKKRLENERLKLMNDANQKAYDMGGGPPFLHLVDGNEFNTWPPKTTKAFIEAQIKEGLTSSQIVKLDKILKADPKKTLYDALREAKSTEN